MLCTIWRCFQRRSQSGDPWTRNHRESGQSDKSPRTYHRLCRGSNFQLCTLGLGGYRDFPQRRWVKIVFVPTGERFNEIYFADGAYILPALQKFSWTCRDFRANEWKWMNAWLMDLVFVLHWKYKKDEIRILRHRTPKTNALQEIRSSSRVQPPTRSMRVQWLWTSRYLTLITILSRKMCPVLFTAVLGCTRTAISFMPTSDQSPIVGAVAAARIVRKWLRSQSRRLSRYQRSCRSALPVPHGQL